jgi:hypothetical protein
MKLLPDRALFPAAATAGVVAAVSMAVATFQSFTSSSFNDALFVILTGFTAVVYWYGLGHLGVRIRNQQLHWAALIMILGSILYDASRFFGTYFPDVFIQTGFDITFSYGLALLSTVGLLLAGYAMFSERKRFGTPAVIYCILSLLQGLMLFLGLGYDAYHPVLTVLLYLLGSYVLMYQRAARA